MEAAQAWARGEIKMPVAKKAAHAAHHAATAVEGDPAACAAAPQEAESVAAAGCAWFYERLKHWEMQIEKIEGPWAAFLLNDDAPNKEKLLRLKMEAHR